MNQHLQKILESIQHAEHLTADEKSTLLKSLKDADSAFTISEFKLERTEKVKRTTAILLEETIEELEQKRKAVEQQNKELEIESALERVRTVAMGMKKADELLDICEVLYNELQKLGFSELRNAMINIHDDEKESFVNYDYSDEIGKSINNLTYDIHPLIAKQIKQVKSAEGFSLTSFTGQDLKDSIAFRKKVGEKDDPRIEKADALYYYFYSIGIGSIGISTFSAIGEEKLQLLKRFRNVFDLAYRRYIDITKAEAQAREAQIEVALERTRTQSMIMQHSNELDDSLRVFHEQVLLLGIQSAFSFLWLPDEKKDRHIFWAAWEENDSFKSKAVNYPLDRNEPATAQCLVDWKSDEPVYSYAVPPGAVENYFALWQELIDGVEHLKPEYFSGGLHYVEAFMKYGCFGVMVTNDLSEEEKKILSRFAIEFERTYTRFLDLQKAEAQAKEAIKQASLDRVRGQIASMRSTEDLQRITPIIWQELKSMDIPFIRCGVFIIDEERAVVEAHLASPDGHSLGALHLDFEASEVTKNTVTNWRKKEVYHQHWNKEEFLQWTQTLLEQGQVQNLQSYQGGAAPPQSLDLHFVPFTQGMLYVGNIVPLTADELKLVQSLADAFAIAYARYEDFNKLEKAKESIEITLSELKATQSQLIQSEKMASLGQLTAGIAHEIQNPLNFVNNFSEVSKELLGEMKEEIDNGNTDEAKDIADDVIQNLEKILHHGKRADAIVKGMLQHSRSSTATKEPTDINKLADEYLRLAYHGLRAKDKDFNAALKTDYESTGLIKIVPQDVGRVILNLITNAFYAVTERKKSNPQGYEPVVSVSTKKIGNIIQIQIADNGNGIPQSNIAKIFQPFFTTKPTGQGTGLGLSLAYDIVKAHGGDIKVESAEAGGTTFTIILPTS